MSMPEQSLPPEAQEIVRAEQQRCDAYIGRDVAALERMLSEYFTFSSPLGRVLTKPQLLEAIARSELIFESIERHYDTVSVHRNTASATGRDTVRGSYQGQDFSGHYHFRTTYVQRGRGWEVAATQTNRLADATPEANEQMKGDAA